MAIHNLYRTGSRSCPFRWMVSVASTDGRVRVRVHTAEIAKMVRHQCLSSDMGFAGACSRRRRQKSRSLRFTVAQLTLTRSTCTNSPQPRYNV